MNVQQQEKWQQVADLIQRLGLVSGGQDEPRTAAQVARMTTHQLLQDPVRAAIYNRGWADRTADIQRRLRPQRPQSTSSPSSRTPSLTRPLAPTRTTAPTTPATTTPVSTTTATATPAPITPAPVKPAEPKPVPRTTGVPPGPAVRVRTEAQLARNRRKFQQLKEKRKARETEASQQHRLAKRPTLTSDPEATSAPPTGSTPPEPMEVDKPAPKDENSEEPEKSTSHTPPHQSPTSDGITEDDWYAAFEGLEEIAYDPAYYTPIGSPKSD
ncbi:proteoglycan 4-like [Acyrthosiphon pisum]|uniref:Uncharacterized protein n=1 Tax=Acyrthosiphon pisum TaxID=7029 RepID=A0A8R2B5F8_ACYPI|nr:proteoglycan 4-like [Acyrthosiphon pisum]|eukprot:XP_008182525.1 PREDICTED: proteoglycan 4-like [Acyrthosiphon pisum]